MKSPLLLLAASMMLFGTQAWGQSQSRGYKPSPSGQQRANQQQATQRINQQRAALAKQRAEKERMAREERAAKNRAALASKPKSQIQTLASSAQTETEFLNKDYLVFGLNPDTSSSVKLPLVIYLHGSGGRGDDIRKINGQVSAVVKGINTHGFGQTLVVAPQCGKGTGDSHGVWTPQDLNVLLSHLKQTLPIDESRVYLTGNSMGGYGTWVWASNHPEHFAAVAPVVGGLGRGGPKDISPNVKEWAKNLATVPVWAFAGANDKVVPADRATRMVDAIRSNGSSIAKVTVYPDEGHTAGKVVYESKEFYEWMFRQRRS